MTALTTTSNRALSASISLPSQDVKDLTGCRVPFHPIDAQTHIGHATVVKSVNNLLGEEEPIRRHHAAMEPKVAHGGEDFEKIGMKGWLATHQGDGPGAEVAKQLEPPPHRVKGNGFKSFVVFRAIATAKIASSGDDHLCQEWSVTEPIEPRNESRARSGRDAGRQGRCEIRTFGAHATPTDRRGERSNGGSMRSRRIPQA